MQTWALMQAFPFLFMDIIEKLDHNLSEKVKDLLTYHLEIMKIILSFEIHQNQVDQLRGIVILHNSLLSNMFPSTPKIKKLHHLLHYADNIIQTGPTRLWWTARYEAEHLEIKRKVYHLDPILSYSPIPTWSIFCDALYTASFNT